ncbi:unnamed protein product [Clonostachys solani]|uniref:Uncharacterized protein n=1 Tax=Clonostachys solani TaxID=160281 RepID=A0A9N9ZA31_9HYPO|nr:unnamed protein product [Clonostachys solani]
MLKEMSRDDPCYAACCCLLGIAYYDRYENLGAFADLELFLTNLETALNLTPQGDSSWAVRSRTMVIAYHVRYSRTGDPSVRKRAMDKHQECLGILSLDDLDSATSLAGLAQGYYNQYLAVGEPEDLKRAIHHQEAALERLPADESLGGIDLLRDLGSMYLERYILPSGSMSDVDKAIEKYELALEKTPEHQPSKARQLAALGVGYYNKYQREKDRRYIEKALEQERQAFNHAPSHVGDRLESGVLLLRRYSEVNDWSQAYEIAVKVLAWVPQIMHRFLDNSDKQSQLGALVGVASDAAAIALSAGKPAFEALRLVEIGRGNIAGSLNDMRLDVSTLEQQYPKLAKEYTTLRDRILALKNSSGDRVDERYAACEKLEQVIKDIQDPPGFDRFHGELSEQESIRAAEHGPVVIVNVSEIRCDALIIEKLRIYTVPLPELDHYEAQEFATGSLQDRNILEWLWRTIAEPVLDVL